MLIPAFQLYLPDKILRGQATVGRYDGKHPCLTCATSGGKIFIHNPHKQELGGQAITYLNINKTITTVLAGRLDPNLDRDVLLVGTPTSLQSYDVQENRDLFFCEIPDGVNSTVLGKLGTIDAPLAVIGGNCSIQGFDAEGTELFWTVTGDNVSSLSLVDTNEDGITELLVGSDDFDIRIFQNEDVISEVSEADVVVGLTPIRGSKYGYALANGTIGVYNGTTRVWRVKSKHSVCAISSFDLDGDGVPELLSGWSNGRFEVRKEETGDVVFRDNFNAPISAILHADYRSDGVEQVIVCSEDGEVRGYVPAESQGAAEEVDLDVQRQTLEKLNQKKQELLYELSNLNIKTSGRAPGDTTSVIPEGTEVSCDVVIDKEGGETFLQLKTNNEALIKGAIIFGENLFANESHFTYVDEPAQCIRVPLSPPKDIACDTLVKILVGDRSGSVYNVVDHEPRIPKFLMYANVESGQDPHSHVAFVVKERVSRLCLWLCDRFSLPPAEYTRSEEIHRRFVSLRDGRSLVIKFMPQEMTCKVVLLTDNMEVAGDIVQDLCSYLGVTEMQSSAEFPAEMDAFKGVLSQVEEHNATRLRLAADVADNSNLVKMFVMKAEDARILGDMDGMKKAYRKLFELNQDLVAEHTKRATNHAQLLEVLKDVNQMIQRAARLRVGQAKTKVVNACRVAIKQNNVQSLFKILKDGDVRGEA